MPFSKYCFNHGTFTKEAVQGFSGSMFCLTAIQERKKVSLAKAKSAYLEPVLSVILLLGL